MIVVIVILLVIIIVVLIQNNNLKKEELNKENRESEKMMNHIEYELRSEDRYQKWLNTEKWKKRQQYEKNHPEEASKYWKHDITMKEYIVDQEVNK